jgi:hypothetical protein
MYAAAYYGSIGYAQIPLFVFSIIIPTIAEALGQSPSDITVLSNHNKTAIGFTDDEVILSQEILHIP